MQNVDVRAMQSAAAAGVPQSGPQPGGPTDRRVLRVLVADNDADTADSLALLVAHWGHRVVVARSGSEAFSMALLFCPDVMLMDIAMREMDGHCVARAARLQPTLAGALLVAVTGYVGGATRDAALKAGFDRYLIKPVEPEVVEALLAGRCGSSARTAPLVAGRG